MDCRQKTILEKFKKETNKYDNIPSLWTGRKYYQGINTSQSNQQIQCNN